MPDQALAKINQLAGFEYPAVEQSLNHFLSLSFSDDTEQLELVSAVESDPAILAVFLSNSQSTSLPNWYEGLNQSKFRQEMRDTALTLSNSFMRQSVSEPLTEFYQEQWQRALLRANLASNIAKLLEMDPGKLRLMGLLTGIGQHFLARTYGDQYLEMLSATTDATQRQDQERQQFGCDSATFGADLLSSWGYSAGITDAILFQYESFEALDDVAIIVKAIAFCTQCVEDLIGHDQKSSLNFLKKGQRLLGLSSSEIESTIEAALKSTEKVVGSIGASQGFSANLADANVVNAVGNGVIPSGAVSQSAKLFFGANAAIMFELKIVTSREMLVHQFDADDNILIVKDSKESLVAKCFRELTPVTAEEEALTSIVDKQLLKRLGSSVGWFVPVEDHGVLVCGFDTVKPIPKGLLDAYTQAITSLTANISSTAMLDAEIVQKQINEVTHEVNNPLAIVQNYLQTLSMKMEEDSPVQSDIATIRNELMRVANIVQKYGQIGKQTDLLMEKVNLNDILMQLGNVVDGGNELISVEFCLDVTMPDMTIDADNVRQVVLNLLKNAVEAIGSQPGKIVIGSCSLINLGGEHYTEITIADNGPGISSKIQKRLFQPNNTSKQGGHKGIGLNITKHIVDEMDGLVSCRTPTGDDGGTSFQILLPVQQ
jgi:nitrogen-specific signal transduction histidine kinase